PLLAAGGLAFPLPATVYRLAAELVVETEALAARAGGAEATEPLAVAAKGKIVLSTRERAVRVVSSDPRPFTPGPPIVEHARTPRHTSVEKHTELRVESAPPAAVAPPQAPTSTPTVVRTAPAPRRTTSSSYV